MIGELPKILKVGDEFYPIETDYRNILVILLACADPDLEPAQQLEIMMRRLYRDRFKEIPSDLWEEAASQARWFIDCGQEADEKKPSKKLMDWEQDEWILFPAINKVAGYETRSVPYLHRWTFAGYFMEIAEGTFSTVLGIRQKMAKGKRLEKWEQEFRRENKDLCDLKTRYTAEEQAEIDYWNKLLG